MKQFGYVFYRYLCNSRAIAVLTFFEGNTMFVIQDNGKLLKLMNIMVL